MFKSPNLIPTNTKVFCGKIPHLTDYAGDSYQVADNIDIVRSEYLTRLFDNSVLGNKATSYVLPYDGWVPLAPRT